VSAGPAGYRDAKSAEYRDAVILSSDEERELYILLKPQERTLQGPLDGLLRRIEKSLFSRLTIEEIEKLAERFPPDR
jgi:hypothetical protein